MKSWLKHITHLLSDEQVLAGYDRVVELYPHVPSLSMWRAWEYAAYQGRLLQQPVLDVGCGDGRWFQLVWPEISDVYGIDMEPTVVERAIQSGVYRQVWQADAAAMPVDPGTFGTVFANCSLEHMDNIHTVMSNAWCALRPGGLFVFSIVTDKINDWFAPAALARALGEDALAHNLYDAWLRYHHLVNPFPIEHWCEGLIDAGFEVAEHIPIIPEMIGRLFLLIDGLWHAQQNDGEIGDKLYPYLQQVPNFPVAFRGILQSALMMESHPQIGCGAVLIARKVERAGVMIAKPERLCWCGESDLHPFSADYLVCSSCGTLASQVIHGTEPLAVHDDQRDFYGKEYWLSHQRQDLGLPDIYQRARADLPERCLYWLRTLLAYKQPPAKVLELGASHGGFVALLRWAGFDAIGTELSPWVVDFARQTFDVPMLLGDVDQQQLPEQSFDVIILNDVLEHLPDPLGTLRHCAALLKPNGIMLIQTPSYPDPQTYKELVRGENRFIEMLEAKEHLYLFSQRAVRQLFGQLGYAELRFLPALFDYDMYVIAGKQPVASLNSEEITRILTTSPAGRMVQALLDKNQEVEQLREQISWGAGLEADVTYLKAQIGTLESQHAEHQSLYLDRIAALEAQLAANEADRVARLKVIERQGTELGRIPALEADVAYLKAQVAAAEADRAARLAVIERQGGELGQLQHTLAQTLQRMEHVHNLLGTNKLKYMVGILPARWEQIQQLLQPLPISSVSTNNHAPSPEATPDLIAPRPLDPSERPDLELYSATISEFNSTQTNAAFLDGIRLYNHTTIETLDSLRPLRGKRLLDIGASPHGYALERALALGVVEYVGIGLDVGQSVEVQSGTGRGRLLYMNAEQLDFPDQSFDLVVSLSTFEHVGDVPRVLSEIKRVLKPGGSALITFEPIWTCSYGHHLHHFGPIAAHMPDWAHLLWDANRMRAELAATWPADGAISLDEAIAWTYTSSAINRIGITQMRAYFEQSGLVTEWMVLLPDQARDPERVQLVAEATSLSPTELMTKGLSVFLNREDDT